MANKPAPYVITCGDEGVQINHGTRLSFVGAGYELPGFSQAVKILKKILDPKIKIASNQENDWIRKKMNLTDWDQTNASAQQQIEALADQEGLLYVGYLPFADPRKLKYDIKGHMVRPKKVHVANKICFTLGGGEQTYNLGCYQISADWVGSAPKKIVEQVILPQLEFYKKLSGIKLPLVYELAGVLGEKVAQKNLKALEKIGLKLSPFA
ncbi:MAG: hypothetical protein A2383_00775 [Candidatus Pacebacteria bacterium RIFOXYB1_FULL_39_46]|nr:MAG: hypothetical protein A2182_00610 [Candidatus Pacebacteria bacterium RIFOXYA1_FULL_38_18]OGJ38120.1 MAG: hypothetical protein A2383_00775 [Candidatus Pacebacteria bacterium RIFOXYB1_FULL_39_46]OGJ39658.1 MAG: hypothetical protein A2411_02665 [Candidatus Pacebacteria bacterium RIFOXYC1_FULL_39_21]OGJ39872.1 MAG: hypothetical protein A2582_00540 [Candidatus Pacebacteria bacterium RIFOXYD1_FULL_39_27]